jgi:hypothetical protein
MGGILRLLIKISAIKVFLGGLFMTIFGIVLYNVLTDIINEMLVFTLDSLNGVEADTTSAVASFTGVAAWFADKLQFQECVAFALSIVALKWTLRKIPFVRW